MKQLTEDQIKQMDKLATDTISNYGALITMQERYEEIYFMTRKAGMKEIPNKDPNDIKHTISSTGRNAVIGMTRIMGTAKVHVKVKDAKDPDKIEAALLKMLKVSGEFKQAAVEKDVDLSLALFGPASLVVEGMDDLLITQTNDDGTPKNEYVMQQLERIKQKTPFLIRAMNAKQSFPIWGAYGMVGHVWRYKIKGSELRDRWGVEADDSKDYEITDTFHYEKRLTRADTIKEPLMAAEWVTRDKKGKMIGSISIPIFTRYSGGSTLFNEPEKQMQPLLYALAMGEWDKRETLFWTYVFTALYQQGLPGKTLLIDPENATQTIDVNYQDGIKTVVAKGQFADMSVIDRDVMQIKGLMDEQAAVNTIQPQTLGANTQGVTFSQFAIANKAGLIPAQNPKEAEEALYRDAFTHILERIKHEGIDNELLSPNDIPEKIELEVVIEPDLTQDDLRNAQIAAQLRGANSNVSDEWINTNILHIANSHEMRKQKDKEDIHKAIIGKIVQDPNVLQKYVMAALGEKPQQKVQGQNAEGGGQQGQPTPEQMQAMAAEQAQAGQGGPGMEGQPQTDAMIPPEMRQ